MDVKKLIIFVLIIINFKFSSLINSINVNHGYLFLNNSVRDCQDDILLCIGFSFDILIPDNVVSKINCDSLSALKLLILIDSKNDAFLCENGFDGELCCKFIDDPLIRFYRGMKLYNHNLVDEAIIVLKDISSIELYFANLGELAYKENDFDLALEYYKMSDIVKPVITNDIRLYSYQHACNIYRFMNDLSSAKLWCDKVLQIKRRAWAYKALGSISFLQLDFYESAEMYKMAVIFDKNDAQSHYWLGASYEKLGEPCKAHEEFAIASFGDPQNQQYLDAKKNAKNICTTKKYKNK